MTCRCGGNTASQSAQHQGHSLEFSTCSACGRSGFWMLYGASGELILSGEEAQSAFLSARDKSSLERAAKAEAKEAQKASKLAARSTAGDPQNPTESQGDEAGLEMPDPVPNNAPPSQPDEQEASPPDESSRGPLPSARPLNLSPQQDLFA